VRNIKVSLLFHANLLYAEFPFSRIADIVSSSYIPVLRAVLSVPEVKAVFNFSGFSLELLAGEHPEYFPGSPEVLDLLRQGIASKRIELAGTSWAHAVLPLLPLWLMEEDINLFQKTVRRVLGITPSGFFPPELAVSPLLPELLRNEGYVWSFVDSDLVDFSKRHALNTANEFDVNPMPLTKLSARASRGGIWEKFRFLRMLTKLIAETREFHPLSWEGTGGNRIWGIKLESAWITLTLLCLSRMLFFGEKQLLHAIHKSLAHVQGKTDGLFFPYSSDIEFYGVGGNTIKTAIPVSRLKDVLVRLGEDEAVSFALPSDVCGKFPPDKNTESCYIKAGSWSSDRNFDLWQSDPDNYSLGSASLEAASLFLQKRGKLDKEQEQLLLKDLLLAFNSDGRGWTPLPEHRLFCYNKAMAVRRTLK